MKGGHCSASCPFIIYVSFRQKRVKNAVVSDNDRGQVESLVDRY